MTKAKETIIEKIIDRIKSPYIIGLIVTGLVYLTAHFLLLNIAPSLFLDVINTGIKFAAAIVALIAAFNNPANKKEF